MVSVSYQIILPSPYRLEFSRLRQHSRRLILPGRRSGQHDRLISRSKTFASPMIRSGTSGSSACRRRMTAKSGSGEPAASSWDLADFRSEGSGANERHCESDLDFEADLHDLSGRHLE